MTDDKGQQKWFIAERSKALAMVVLTRRDDLVVRNAGQDTGLQFLVSFSKGNGEPAIRQFGVFLRGTKSPVIEAHLDRTLRPKMQSYLRKGPFPYPVCLFHFTMDDDQGYFTWVAEPAVADEEPRLLLQEGPHSRKLDRAALDEIVDKVDRWYDVFFRQITVKAS
jgi:hypothetical protein